MKKNLLPVVLLVGLLLVIGLKLYLSHKSAPTQPTPPLDYPATLLGGQAWINERVAEYAFKDEIIELLCRERYGELEALASELQAHPRYFIHGWTGFDSFLGAFDRIATLPADEQTRYLARLTDWQIEMPQSKLAPLLVATCLVEKAEASNPQSIEVARGAVSAAQKADPGSAQAWVLAMALETFIKGKRENVDAAFAEAQKRDPDSYAAWYQKIDYMLTCGAPRAEILATLNAAADASKAQHGDSYYALLVWHHKAKLHPHWSDNDVSWPRTRQGFLDLGQQFPYALGALNGFALFAREAQDDGTAHALADRIGPNWDVNTFPDDNAWQNFVRQESDAPASLEADQIPYQAEAVKRLIPIDHLSSRRRAREFGGQVNELMLEGHFDAVEALASTLRASPWFRSGDGSLSVLYEGFSLGPTFSDSQCKQYLAALKSWTQARPASSTAKVALAHVLVEWAWWARGSGYADTVSEQGMRLFHQRLEMAQKALEGVEDDPQAFTEMSTVARGLGWSSDATRALIDKATQKYPRYLPTYDDYAQTLLPRWHGAPGDVETYAEQAASATRKDMGQSIYPFIASVVYAYEGLQFFEHTRFKWALIRQGLDDAMAAQRTPPGVVLRALSWMAWVQHDTATQVRCLRAINDVDLLLVGATPFAAKAFMDGLEKGFYQKGSARNARGENEPIEDAPLTASVYQAGVFDLATGAPRLVQPTDHIAAKNGTSFGLVLKINRGSNFSHRIRCDLIGPSGPPRSSELAVDDLSSPYLFMTRTFGDQTPAEKGVWTMQMRVDGKLIGEKKFNAE